MQIVIDIHEKDYQSMLNGHIPYSVLYAIMNGTLLPKGHGRLIDADELNVYGTKSIIAVLEAPTIIEADKGE